MLVVSKSTPAPPSNMLMGHTNSKLAPPLCRSKLSGVPAVPARPRPNTAGTRQAITAPLCCRDWHLNTNRRSGQKIAVKSVLDENHNGINYCGRADSHSDSRRTVLRRFVTIGLFAFLEGPPSPAIALPLGPLGPVRRVGGDKQTGLSVEEVAEVLRRDLARGQYFVTGNLTREVFADDCRFIDPTNDVTGLSKYLTALKVLFDPQFSKVELLDIRVAGPRTVEADWRLGGYLAFPWNPRVEPFTGHTVYTLNDDGLVSEQRQTWSISAATALIESFTPTLGPRRQLF
ncbi:hypothetical protein VaNZ11_016708 [Volvox africanus]|uniref:SnoaL-like domain-containing protein n=1 Tax=Volvox africanus TaxID=51714 RepID=A0ABQ5SNB2_9CHLO|nr:hypothetical protein VaNZ11_016708 [Volvox africanus]